MFANLLGARRFAALFWCQFFSAFNDNFVRQMLAMLILFTLGEKEMGSLITLAVAIFVLPSVFLSGLGGEIADGHDKALIARRLKFAEIFVQMIAAAGFWCSAQPALAYLALPLLYTALFGLGTIAALFGPIKYGILPDQLETSELPAGNALIEGATFLAILLGLIAGGYAAANGRDVHGVMVQLMVVALACWISSRLIPPTKVAEPGLKPNANIIASSFQLVAHVRQDKRLWSGGLAVSWFWMVGAVALSLIPVVIRQRIGGGIDVETGVSALFAIGIAIGSILAAVVSRGRIFLLPVPIAGLFMAGFLIDIGFATYFLEKASSEISLMQFLATSRGIRIAIDIAGLAAAGGLFVVPAFAAVQSFAGEECRARVVAGVNIVTALFMVAGSLVTALLQMPAIGLSEPGLLIGLGVLNIGAAIYFFKTLPANFAVDFLNVLFRLWFRVEVKGMENIEAAGEHCVIAVNHLSLLDAPVILSVLQKKPVFAIDAGIAKAWYVKPFLGLARTFPMDPTKPLSTRALINEVKAGNPLIIFPEGRITVTGALMKVYDGAAMIADKSNAMVVPVRLEGLERTPFSYLAKSQVARSLFPKVRITFLPPRKMQLDETLGGKARRQAAGAALYDIMSDLMFATTQTERTIFSAIAESARQMGLGREMVADPITGPLSARKVLMGAAILGRKIMAFTQAGENVGLMVPNANAAAVSFLALQQIGRVPAMLNYTSGVANLGFACTAAAVRTVLTSRAFVEKGKLENLIAAIEKQVKIVYLEDIRASIAFADKARGFLDAGKPLVPRRAEDPAVVLFTSGSEGVPKGVVLSHANIVSNVAQIDARADFSPADKVFNVLPVFHSFGLTGGMLLPMMTGMKLFLYPSPLHYRAIPELVYTTNATVLFGTDTFFNGYARMANPYDFRSVRYLVAGAEPVKAETRRVYMEKFGLRVLEGYGVTETAPVLAVNTPMFFRAGTVGRLMPGIDWRLENVPGIEGAGRLHVKGPNVMMGYYRIEKPGVLEPTPDGWHDTGDICEVDARKFITIKGRAKRFAKIGGEMVSLAAVEAMLGQMWPEDMLAMVSVPDARKGERLILVTAKQDAHRSEVQAYMKAHGATEIMMPAEILVVDALPLLGSGKMDFAGLGKLVRERLQKAAA